jgi:hypothetical protein
MMNQKSSATPQTVERFARRPLPSRSGFPDRFVSGFNAMGRLFAVKIHVAGESPFGLSSARRIFRRHAPRDGQSARCGDASHSVTVTESEAEPPPPPRPSRRTPRVRNRLPDRHRARCGAGIGSVTVILPVAEPPTAPRPSRSLPRVRNRLRDRHGGRCGMENPFSFNGLSRFYEFLQFSSAAEAVQGINQEKQQNRK